MSDGASPAIYWYLTYQCNLTCRHCSVESSIDQHDYVQLSDEDVLKATQRIISGNPLVVCLSGGEPLVHSHFEDVLARLLDAGCQVRVETNATLISRCLTDLLQQKDEYCRRVLFLASLDGTEDDNDAIRGNGAFRDAVAGMQLLRSRGIHFEVQCTLNRLNAHHIEELARLVLEEIGADKLKFGFTFRLGRADDNWETLCLSPQEFDEALPPLCTTISRYPGKVLLKAVPGELPPTAYLRMRGGIEKCLITSCRFPLLGILPDGTITICSLTRRDQRLKFGNVNQDSIGDIWHSRTMEHLRTLQESHSITGICARCVFLPGCGGGCRALAYERYGSFCSPYPVCQEIADSGLFQPAYVRPFPVQTTSRDRIERKE